MMPSFDRFVAPAVSKKLLGEIRVENDPVLQFAEEFLSELAWDLVPWGFLYGIYAAWMRKEVPSGFALYKREFVKRVTAYVGGTPSCGWAVAAVAVRLAGRLVGNEPLAVEYDLSNWIDLKPVGGSVRKIGIPHNMSVSTRGLLRTTAVAVSKDDDLTNNSDN